MNKKRFLAQGIILTAISMLLRVMHIGYRSFLSQKIGTEGIGLFQLIFTIFMLAVTLSTSGISLAVTRMVSAAIINGKRSAIRSVVAKCFAFCLLLSVTIAILLFCFADVAAEVLLGNAKAANSLRILGVGLPFMSIATCMKGYFLAVDESIVTAIADVIEQILTIGAAMLLFWYFAPQSLERACFAVMLASTLGEIIAFCFSYAAYRISLRKNTPKHQEKGENVLHGLTHIALPCTLSSAARSLLSAAENLLIPKELQRNGLNYASAMSQYGLLQGMAMPILYFPASLLASFGNLLIPRISMEREQNHKKAVEHIAGKAITYSLQFGFFFSAIFFLFGDTWGQAFYDSPAAGEFLRVLAPIVPLVYLDVVVDCMLKGMDEQFNSMKFNLADSAIRVLLVLCLLRFFGIESYIGIIFFSTIFNASLSLGRLIKVTQVRISFVRHILLPISCAVVSTLLASLILAPFSFERPMFQALLQLSLSLLIFLLLRLPLQPFMQIIIRQDRQRNTNRKEKIYLRIK